MRSGDEIGCVRIGGYIHQGIWEMVGMIEDGGTTKVVTTMSVVRWMPGITTKVVTTIRKLCAA